MTADPRHRAALDRLLELTVAVGDDMASDLARTGLTRARAHALWTLGRIGPCTQRVLADALGVTARNVTGLVDGLAETGFVTREPHPDDRRAILVSFTARGEETVASLRRRQDEFAAQLFAGMPERRFAEFAAGLDDVLATVRRELDELGAQLPGPG